VPVPQREAADELLSKGTGWWLEVQGGTVASSSSGSPPVGRTAVRTVPRPVGAHLEPARQPRERVVTGAHEPARLRAGLDPQVAPRRPGDDLVHGQPAPVPSAARRPGLGHEERPRRAALHRRRAAARRPPRCHQRCQRRRVLARPVGRAPAASRSCSPAGAWRWVSSWRSSTGWWPSTTGGRWTPHPPPDHGGQTPRVRRGRVCETRRPWPGRQAR
jgi:hypothetical protein